MNNRGKGAILFIILIPAFFLLSILICDTLVSYSTNKKYKIITEKIIKETFNSEYYYDEYEDYIKKLYKRNNYEIDMLYVETDENRIYIENEHRYFGVISSLLNKSGETKEIKILGIPFKVKKSSKTFIKVEGNMISEDEFEFIYTK